MLPIVANIVANDHKKSAKHGFMLSSAYGIGVSTAYGMLGAVVAVFGRQYIIQAMQSKPILLVSAGIFVVLAIYMLGLIHIKLPFAISQKIHSISEKGHGNLGGFLGSAIAGFFSAIVVSPCVTAPLVGALIGVASVGDPVFGFIALFMLGIGLSVPLIIVGTTEGSIMPKSGAWMDWIKHGFALLLFAVAILIIDRVFESSYELLLWACLAVAFAVWFWMNKAKGQGITKALSVIMLLWAGLLAYGAFAGSMNPLKPWDTTTPTNTKAMVSPSKNISTIKEPIKQHKPLIKLYNMAELNNITQKNQLVIVDVWASWCIECKHMEAALFHKKPDEMLDWQLVKLDISEVNSDSKEVMETLNLFGPPALAFYKNGELLGVQHGMTKRDKFIEILTSINPK